jgi:hypothetical protein
MTYERLGLAMKIQSRHRSYGIRSRAHHLLTLLTIIMFAYKTIILQRCETLSNEALRSSLRYTVELGPSEALLTSSRGIRVGRVEHSAL